MDDKFLNLEEKDLEKSVYRIFNAKYFFDLAITKKNTIVHPKKWDDPFENFLLNLPIKTPRGKASNRGKKMVYGQCWSLSEESDLLWKIYSPNNFGIKIKTSLKMLFESFKKSFEVDKNKHSFIGKVQYYNPKKSLTDIIDAFEATRKWSLEGYLEANQLLYKRDTFSYENEIRLIGYYLEKNPCSELLKYKIDPFKLFSEIVLDPRLSECEFKNLKEEIIALGFDENIISKSKLYKLNQNELRVLNHDYE